MKTGIILASSQIDKLDMIYEATRQYARGAEVINFGCFQGEETYSYVEIAVEVGLLLASGAVDFMVTGCSSGQGMMLACNTMPGVICGYAPTPMDAYLFAQINDGNAISLPLGEAYTYAGEENCIRTIEKLFSEPFGQGYPKADAARKLKDTAILKDIKQKTHIDPCTLLDRLDGDLVRRALSRKNVAMHIIDHGSDPEIKVWVKAHMRP